MKLECPENWVVEKEYADDGVNVVKYCIRRIFIEEEILKVIQSDKLELMGMDAIKTAKENTIERSMLDTLSILKEFNESK